LTSERERLVEAHHVATRDFDRAVITLSGGALALSVTFIHDVVPHAHETWRLVGAWSLLGASLLLMVASFVTSQAGLLRSIQAIDNREVDSHEQGYFRATRALNLTSAIAMVAGFGFLAWFSFANIN